MSQYRHSLGLRLLQLACRVGNHWERARGTDTSSDMASFIPFYKSLWAGAARAIAAEFMEVAEGFWRVRLGSDSTLINNYIVQVDDPVVLRVAGHKALCHRLLRNEGLPVPDHQTYRINEIKKAQVFMRKYPEGYFVVKPAVGTSGGRGVTLYVRSPRECRRASIRASLLSDQVIIERLIVGQCYRLLFLDGEMIDAVRQRGVCVTGDGKSSIRQLLKERCAVSGAPFNASFYDNPDYRATIAAQGLRDGFVPELGRTVLVKSCSAWDGKRADIRTDYDECVTNLICAELQAEAARAVKALRSRFASVELVTRNPAVSLEKSGGAIIEINTTPGLHRHCFGTGNGDGGKLALDVLSYLMREARAKAGVSRSFTS